MAVVYRSIFALIGWSAVALQYALAVRGQPAEVLPSLTLNFFSYFTILTNVLVALALTAPAVAPRSRLGRWAASEGVRAAIAMYIAVVGLTYHFLLSRVWDPQGLLWLVNGLLHYVMPIAFVADWLLFTPKGRLRWIDPVKWLSFPLLYTGWTLAHGYASGFWPYWFMNLPALGFGKAAFWAAVMMAGFLITGLALVALDRLFGRGDRTRVPA